MRCRTPRCQGESDDGERFCPPCRERLGRIRAEIDSGSAERLRSARLRRRSVHRSCEVPDCPDWAKPGEKHCLHHLRVLGS